MALIPLYSTLFFADNFLRSASRSPILPLKEGRLKKLRQLCCKTPKGKNAHISSKTEKGGLGVSSSQTIPFKKKHTSF